MRMRFIIYYYFSILITFIVNEVLICFVMRFSSLIFLSLFRFKASNYDIKKIRVFSYIDTEIDNYIRDINI